ncbi:MAG: EamA family transporter [Bacteroidetes bacterium MedPE-SWsnd-G1]|nr:MAG: EamA family transporter [Bacteroidetes bacterium MedPE-SWsnd-G1]
MKGRILAFLAALGATLIYGANYSIAKDVMPLYVKPYGFIILRVVGACLLFWILGLFVKKEKIDKKDFIPIFFAGLFGAALNMLFFFKGLSLTTPINASVIMIVGPILVFILSILFLKEKLVPHRILGVLIGFIGAAILVIYGKSEAENAPNIVLGNLYIFINASSYAVYLIIIKKLLEKYHPFTLIKWVYLFGLFVVVPFGFSEFQEIEWGLLPESIIYKILFVVVFTTFFAYLFNIIALTKLKTTTVAAFIYLQPVVTSIFALILGSDELSTTKVTASLIIFLGVYLVSKRPKQTA